MTVDLRIVSSEVPDGAAVRVQRDGVAVCIVRIGTDVFAVEDRCSHANIALSEGEVDPEARTVECWKHGSTFSLLDGKPQCLPATRPVPVYTARMEGDEIVVDVP